MRKYNSILPSDLHNKQRKHSTATYFLNRFLDPDYAPQITQLKLSCDGEGTNLNLAEALFIFDLEQNVSIFNSGSGTYLSTYGSFTFA